jgi:hypothetical protein
MSHVLSKFQRTLGRQEDAHEFFTACIVQLHAEMSGLLPGEGRAPAATEQVSDGDDWQEIGSKKKVRIVSQVVIEPNTPVNYIFGGRTRLVLSKQASNRETVSVQPFYSLHLDIAVRTPHFTTFITHTPRSHISCFPLRAQTFSKRCASTCRAKWWRACV